MSQKNKQPSDGIAKNVMDQIKGGKVQMKPRAYYVSLGLVSAAAVVLAGVALAYLSSVVFFWLRVVTADTMAWGARSRLSESISSFPWWALLLAALLVALAVYLVRRHGRLYRIKTGWLVVAIVVASMLVGLGLSLLNVGQTHPRNQPNNRGQRMGPGWQRNF